MCIHESNQRPYHSTTVHRDVRGRAAHTKSFAKVGLLVHEHLGTNDIAIVAKELDQISIRVVRWEVVYEEVGSFRA